jgi:hypothetical protein
LDFRFTTFSSPLPDGPGQLGCHYNHMIMKVYCPSGLRERHRRRRLRPIPIGGGPRGGVVSLAES